MLESTMLLNVFQSAKLVMEEKMENVIHVKNNYFYMKDIAEKNVLKIPLIKINNAIYVAKVVRLVKEKIMVIVFHVKSNYFFMKDTVVM